MYEILAQIYDRTGQARFSLKMVGYLLEMLALRRLKPRRVLDLACGTGAAAVAMAKRRFEVTGVDGSEAMLLRARERAARWGVNVDWRQANLPELELAGPYDLATCFYDSLNHLTDPQDLLKTFFAVRRALAPGGHFFFDMNTDYALRQVWGAAEDSHLEPDYARFWRSRFDPETGLATLEATYFVQEEGDRFRRLDVTHHARGYDPEQVEEALTAAGFELVEAYECLSFMPATPETYRVAYLARA
ncbi:MAG: class I SAM-dependent methyltransferase [Candidatus Sericytochromatia bacterium]